MKYFLLLSLVAVSFSCRTIDVERTVQAPRGTGTPAPVIITVPIDLDFVPPEPIIIEKPIFVPESEPVPPFLSGRAAVEAANRAIVQPRDFSASVMLYDFHRDFVYEVFCRPGRVTAITLQPGERAIEPPFISDSERWSLGAGVSLEGGVPVQHIYVRPASAGLEATLIINTDMRVYHLILRSFSNIHMPIVRWRYPETEMPRRFVQDFAGHQGFPGRIAQEDASILADPRFLSFNYRITYGLFRRPRWLPTMVYDDGRRTYIVFPDFVLQHELPTVFENRADIVNYRVHGNVIIIDKLIERITIRLGNRVATVEKRRRN